MSKGIWESVGSEKNVANRISLMLACRGMLLNEVFIYLVHQSRPVHSMYNQIRACVLNSDKWSMSMITSHRLSMNDSEQLPQQQNGHWESQPPPKKCTLYSGYEQIPFSFL